MPHKERLPDEEYAEILKEFEALAIEMKAPFSVERWDMEVKAPGGKIEDKRSFYSQSWLRNMHNVITGIFCSVGLGDASPNWGQAYLNMRVQNGTISTTTLIRNTNVTAVLGEDHQGILVGTGADAEDVDDYAISSLVSHGRSAGELYYYRLESASQYVNWAWTGGTRKFSREIVRYLANWSGGTITITNVGITSNIAGNKTDPELLVNY